jgi:hypothetical protein
MGIVIVVDVAATFLPLFTERLWEWSPGPVLPSILFTHTFIHLTDRMMRILHVNLLPLGMVRVNYSCAIHDVIQDEIQDHESHC